MNVGEAITAGIKANLKADYQAISLPRRITLRGGPHNGRQITCSSLGIVRVPTFLSTGGFHFDDYDASTGNYLEAQ